MLDLISSLQNEYSLELDALATLLNKLGHKVKPYHDPAVPIFRQLSESKQYQVLQALTAYRMALQDVTRYDDNIDMSQFVWRFLMRLGIAPSEDLFQTIRHENFIQIYNLDQFQIFRSLRCFERCSFTLEELTSKSWYELWDRDSLFYYALTGLATKILQFIKPTHLRLDFPYHNVREIESESLFDFRYKIKTIHVLTKRKKALAAVLIEDWQF